MFHVVSQIFISNWSHSALLSWQELRKFPLSGDLQAKNGQMEEALKGASARSLESFFDSNKLQILCTSRRGDHISITHPFIYIYIGA